MNNPIKSLTRREWCLWLASLAVAVNFTIFLLNDLYGFISWKKREVLQTA